MVSKKNISFSLCIIIFLNIIFLLSFFIKFYFFSNDYSSITGLFVWTCFLIIIQMLSFKLKKVSIYDFGLWFIILSYFFLFGLLFREVLSLDYSLLWNPIISYNSKSLYISYSYSIICLCFFGIGYLLSYNDNFFDKSDSIVDLRKRRQMFKIGLLFFVVGCLCKFYNDFRVILSVRASNSYSAYSSAVSSGLFDDFAALFLPGLFLMFFSDCLSKKSKFVLFIFSLIYFIVIMLLTGSRKIQIFSIVSLVLCFLFSEKKNSEKKKISFLNLIFYTFLLFVMLNVLVTIRDCRFELSSMIPTLIENIFSLRFISNILGETFSETGLTLLSIASIVDNVPKVFPFRYGSTFIITIPSCLPIGWLVGDMFYKASSTYVINRYTGIPVGSSLFGDFYWNWGFIGGAICAFLFGILISKLLFGSKTNFIDKNIKYALYFCYFSILIILVRSELIDIFKSLIFVIIISFLILKTNFFSERSM